MPTYSRRQAKAVPENIEERLQFSLKLMTELLDVSNIEAGTMQLKKESNDYRKLLEQTTTFNQLVGKWKNVSVKLDCRDSELVFGFDRNKMEQVLNNLISNAIKYSHPGSSVSVSVKRENQLLQTAVNDHGVGIPEEEQEKSLSLFKNPAPVRQPEKAAPDSDWQLPKRSLRNTGGRSVSEVPRVKAQASCSPFRLKNKKTIIFCMIEKKLYLPLNKSVTTFASL
jgi:hypothetical protein